MRLKKSIFTTICILAIYVLCSENTVYAWESLEQSVINIAAGEATQAPDDPDEPQNPEETDKPEKPGESEKPAASDKPSKKPGSSSAQTEKADADTGDTHQYLRYLVLMLLSFLMIIIIGVTTIVLTINGLENRRS